MNKIFSYDIGKSTMFVFDSSKPIVIRKKGEKKDARIYNPHEYSKEDFINLNIHGLEDGDVMIGEDAHMRESHKQTTAQPFSFKELVSFDKNTRSRNITTRLFPHHSTPKARLLTGHEDKGDAVDAISIAQFVKLDTNVFKTLKHFKPTRMENYQNDNKHIHEYITDANETINEARGFEYGFGKYEFNDAITEFVKKYHVPSNTVFGYQPSILSYLDNDLDLLNFIGLAVNKRGRYIVENKTRIYTFLASFLQPDGSLRERLDGNGFPHWKFVFAHYFGCKPHHKNQGVAASNYKWHWRIAASGYRHPDKFVEESGVGMKSPDIRLNMSLEEYEKFKRARKECDKKLQKAWTAIRKMIVEDRHR